nr:hypothetical protein [Tanacetum cinerariifolium]
RQAHRQPPEESQLDLHRHRVENPDAGAARGVSDCLAGPVSASAETQAVR